MALPIKANDTQEGCNPIASNCIIWQGPDIPCIKLCKGDTISDVSAKLAERLCTILDYLDVSGYDLSCFNPVCPSPKDFQDLVQFILNRICALENIELDPGTPGGGCPDTCIVSIAPCFQENDFLGNLITTLPLRDYVIKVGNELCSLIATVNSQGTAISDLETRVTFIEDNCCAAGGGITDITTTGCVGNGTTQPIQLFLSQFEAAFCSLQEITAGEDLTDAQETLQNLCLTGSENQLTPLITNSSATIALSSLTGWYEPVSNTSQALNNLYLAFCDLRTYVETVLPALVTSVNQCCGVTCADLSFTLTGNGAEDKFIFLTPSGDNIPSGFTYCSSPATKIVVNHMGTSNSKTFNVAVGTNDVIEAINTSSFINAPTGLDMSAGTGNGQESVWYEACIEMCLTDGTLTCNSTKCVTFYNTNICSLLGVSVTATALTTTTGTITVLWTPLTLASAHTIQIYNTAGFPVGAPSPAFGSSTSWTSPPLPGGTSYYATINVCQTSSSWGTKCLPVGCSSGAVTVPVLALPPDLG